jgi:poly-gamma-glutamate synthesis protein (capsule biosynthesis protein)
MKVITFLALLFTISTAFSNNEKKEFPYVYTPEVLEKNWMGVRVEGQDSSYLSNPFRFIGYSIKAFKKKFTAPVEVISYFQSTKKTFNELAQQKVSGENLRLSLVGDLMWLRTGWSGFLESRLKSHFESSDFLFGNLETLISKSHEVPTFLPARATFNSPPSIIDEFKGINGRNLFSALSVANNHSLDYGELGLQETLEVLSKRKIPFSGLLEPKYESTKKRWVKVNRKGITVGFYAATYGMNNRWEEESDTDFNLIKGVAPHDHNAKVDLSEIEGVLQEMKEDKVDLKIVSLHWGFEYEYYPEPKQIIVARDIVKLGADIIMGHHSHSQQPIDVCFVNGMGEGLKHANFKGSCHLDERDNGQEKRRPRKALIVYSLGNFLTNMYGFLSEVGTVLDLDLIRKENGAVDWQNPQVHLVYNERKFKEAEGENDRILLFMDDYLKKNCFRKKRCIKDDLEELKFIKRLYPETSFSLNIP